MKNMKKMLSALTALSFVTVAGVSTVACGPDATSKTNTEMNAKVLADLGIYDEKGVTKLEATLAADGTWSVSNLAGIDASKLLNEDGTAKENSKEFLTNVLKLKAGTDGKFNKEDAQKITLVVGKVNPTLVKVTNDYAFEKGTVTVTWKNGANELATQSLDIKGDKAKGIVASVLPELKLADFDATKAPLSEFKIGGNKFEEGISVKEALKDNTEAGKTLKALESSLGKEMNLTITNVNVSGADKFAAGDSITIKVNFGLKNDTVQFTPEYTFTLGTEIKELITELDLSSEVVPVALSTDTPEAAQIANSVMALNKGATINDFNISNVKVTKDAKEKDDEDENSEYVNGEYTATLVGAGDYYGSLQIKGTFGRLNP